MMKHNKDDTLRLFGDFLDIISTLRSPEGCPWDREQTPTSLRGHLIEESYETLEAIEEADPAHVREELGDVLLLVAMITRMYTESGDFHMGEVLEEINAKLIRRHPHVFGGEKVKDAEDVLKNWERIKVDIEGRNPSEGSVLDGVPGSLPPLERAFKIQKKAAKSGFDWPDTEGPRSKILEELEEIRKAVETGNRQDLEDEIGDLLFSVVNYARHLDVDPSLALARTNRKFDRRFRHVESGMNRDGLTMAPENLELMDRYWESAKAETEPGFSGKRSS